MSMDGNQVHSCLYRSQHGCGLIAFHASDRATQVTFDLKALPGARPPCGAKGRFEEQPLQPRREKLRMAFKPNPRIVEELEAGTFR
jgi:hypothetical protein